MTKENLELILKYGKGNISNTIRNIQEKIATLEELVLDLSDIHNEDNGLSQEEINKMLGVELTDKEKKEAREDMKEFNESIDKEIDFEETFENIEKANKIPRLSAENLDKALENAKKRKGTLDMNAITTLLNGVEND